jgi:hypothetical protein
MANQSRAKHQSASGGPSTRHRLAVYDGRLWLGVFIWNEKTQQALVWNASRQFVERYGSYKAVAQGIGRAAAKQAPIAWEPAPCG